MLRIPQHHCSIPSPPTHLPNNLALVISVIDGPIDVDLRNHGNSPHTDSMLWCDMAADVVKFMDDEGYESARFVGHSLGGKVAMALALLHPDRVENLVVVDIAPVTYPGPRTDGVGGVLRSMMELDLTGVRSRVQADDMARDIIPNKFVRGFVMQNLVYTKSGGAGMVWRCNLEQLAECLPYLSAFDLGDDVGARTAHHDALFVRGEMSKHLHPRHHPEVRRMFPNADIALVRGAGHYLHAQKQDEFGKLLAQFWDDA